MADRVEQDKGLVMMGGTNRANERTPLANLRTTWRADIGVKDNGPGCLGGVVYVSVILVGQGCSDTEITQQYGAVIVDEEVCCFDIPMNKSVDMEITISRKGLSKSSRRRYGETCLRPSRACLRIQRTTSSSMPPGQAYCMTSAALPAFIRRRAICNLWPSSQLPRTRRTLGCFERDIS